MNRPKAAKRKMLAHPFQSISRLQKVSARAIADLDLSVLDGAFDPSDPRVCALLERLKDIDALQSGVARSLASEVAALERKRGAEVTNASRQTHFAEVRSFHAGRVSEHGKWHQATGDTAKRFDLTKSQIRKIVGSKTKKTRAR